MTVVLRFSDQQANIGCHQLTTDVKEHKCLSKDAQDYLEKMIDLHKIYAIAQVESEDVPDCRFTPSSVVAPFSKGYFYQGAAYFIRSKVVAPPMPRLHPPPYPPPPPGPLPGPPPGPQPTLRERIQDALMRTLSSATSSGVNNSIWGAMRIGMTALPSALEAQIIVATHGAPGGEEVRQGVALPH